MECGTVGGSASLSCLLCSLLRLSLDDVGLGHKTEAAPPVQPCKPSPSHPPQHHHHHPGWPTPFHPRPTPDQSKSSLLLIKTSCGGKVNLGGGWLGLFAKPSQGCGAPLRPLSPVSSSTSSYLSSSCPNFGS